MLRVSGRKLKREEVSKAGKYSGIVKDVGRYEEKGVGGGGAD